MFISIGEAGLLITRYRCRISKIGSIFCLLKVKIQPGDLFKKVQRFLHCFSVDNFPQENRSLARNLKKQII